MLRRRDFPEQRHPGAGFSVFSVSLWLIPFADGTLACLASAPDA